MKLAKRLVVFTLLVLLAFHEMERSEVAANPPANPDPDGFWTCGDFRFRVTHVIFNHNRTSPFNDTEGLDLRIEGGADYAHNRVEGGRLTGDVLGEWINPLYGGARNEPALYVCDKTVTVLARIECKDELTAAKFSASEVVPNGGTTKWRDVVRTRAMFVRRQPGVDLWVTHGTGPNNEYCEFRLSGSTRSDIRRTLCSWLWNVSDVEQGGQIVQPPRYPLTTTGEHKFYTVLRGPWHPWYWGGHPQPETTEPWTRALDLLIDRAGTDGEMVVDYACDSITNYLHRRHGLAYDHGNGVNEECGRPRFVRNIQVRMVWQTNPITGEIELVQETDPVSGSPTHHDQFEFELNAYTYPATATTVNCYDQAAGVMALANLIGGWTWYRYMCRYGYINEIEHVGGTRANNPFYMGAVRVPATPTTPEFLFPFERRPVVGVDDLVRDANGNGFLDRSAFGNHAFVMSAPYYRTAWDACVGPIQRKYLDSYLLDAIDRSTPDEAAKAGSSANIEAATGIPIVNLR